MSEGSRGCSGISQDFLGLSWAMNTTQARSNGASKQGWSPGMIQLGLPAAFTGMNWGGMAPEGLSQGPAGIPGGFTPTPDVGEEPLAGDSAQPGALPGAPLLHAGDEPPGRHGGCREGIPTLWNSPRVWLNWDISGSGVGKTPDIPLSPSWWDPAARERLLWNSVRKELLREGFGAHRAVLVIRDIYGSSLFCVPKLGGVNDPASRDLGS